MHKEVIRTGRQSRFAGTVISRDLLQIKRVITTAVVEANDYSHICVYRHFHVAITKVVADGHCQAVITIPLVEASDYNYSCGL